MVVENVRGAQRWVGRAKANYGSYYLWGDVGMVGKRVVASVQYGAGIAPLRGRKTPVGSWDLTRKNYNADHTWDTDGQKAPGRNFHFPEKYGIPPPSFHGHDDEPSVREALALITDEGTKVGQGVPISKVGFNVANQTESDAVLAHLEGVKSFTPNGEPLGKNTLGRKHGSKSPQRKAASAAIAKIPFPLAQHIARALKKETAPL